MKKIILAFLVTSSTFAFGTDASFNISNSFNELEASKQYICRKSDETKKCDCSCLQNFCEDAGGDWGCDAATQDGECVVGHCTIEIKD